MAHRVNSYHIPVLLSESVEGLSIRDGGVYVDATFGGGGHSGEILRRLKGGRLVAFDQDIDAYENLIDDERLIFVRHNFRYMKNFLCYYGIDSVDGILADLGVSSHELSEPGRGFSYRSGGELDMRMNQSAELDALQVINKYSEEELGRVLRSYGEVRNWRSVAGVIVKSRRGGRIGRVEQFIEVIQECVPPGNRNKYLAKIFQALRIEVNGEMEALESLLETTSSVLKPGGRLVVISYHSLEDRMVKNYIKTGSVEGVVEKDFYGNVRAPFRAVNRKVIVPNVDEVKRNPRSRSAKLRVAERFL